ncbi:MAG TPA: hypothetical protein VIE44_11725 [Methylomirabilota bacterium]
MASERREIQPSVTGALRALLISGATALATSLALWKLWWWAGYPLGAFKAGLDGHGPDPYAWPRLLAIWIPAAHLLFPLVYALLSRWSPSPVWRRHFLADQWSLALVPLLLAGLLHAGPEGPWRLQIGAWYTLFIGAKTAILLAGLWRWLSSRGAPLSQASAGLFLGAFLPYLFLGAHTTTAMSSTGDEPYYLLVAHSLLHDGDRELTNNFSQRDYLPFYWGELSREGPEIRPLPGGRVFAPAYQGFQAFLLLPGYAVAGRQGAVITMHLFGAIALVLLFRLALASGASLRSAFLAWLGAAFSAPFVVYAASPFPEMTGALLATATACLLWRQPLTRAAAAAASLCLVAMVAAKTRLFVLVPPLGLGFLRRFSWPRLALAAATLVAALAAATTYDALVLGGHVVRRTGGGNVRQATRWFLDWTVRAPLEYRGQLGLLLDQEFGLLPAAPVFALAIAGIVTAVAERRWRLLLLAAGPFLLAWYYLGAVGLAGITSRGLSYWYGGFSPPVRFLMASLPLLAVLAALALDHVRGRLGWSVTAALFAATLAYTAVLSVWPAWRFQDATGRPTALLALFRRTGLDLGRFLPTFVTPDAGWTRAGLAVLVLALIAGYSLSRGPGGNAPRGACLTGAAAAVLCVTFLAGMAWLRPSASYPAVLGTGRGGATFWGPLPVSAGGTTVMRERLAWATQRNAVLELAPRLPPGRYAVVIRAGAQGTDTGPSLAIQLGTDAPRRVPLESAAPPVWREREYASEIRWSGGRLPIRLELGQVSRQDPVRLAYVDAIEIRRLFP